MAHTDAPETLRERLQRALKSKAVLTERSKQLQQQVDDFRKREETMSHVATELLERQRELNYMLHRASSVLHQLQDTNLALSAEFTHIVKELPAPESAKWEETVSRVNDLFKKTHELAGEMQDDIFRAATGKPSPESAESRRPEPMAIRHSEESQVVVSASIVDVEESAPEPEQIHEAIITSEQEPPTPAQAVAEAIPTRDEKSMAREETIPAREEDSITREEEIPTRKERSIEELFARVDAMDFGGHGDFEEREREKKPGFLGRLFAKLNEED